jgi:tetratricopeptide (TPR) repeat protein
LENGRKDYDRAEREYREAVRCQPNNGDFHFFLGHLLHFARKDYKRAARGYREALRCKPDDAAVRECLDVVLIKLAAESTRRKKKKGR